MDWQTMLTLEPELLALESAIASGDQTLTTIMSPLGAGLVPLVGKFAAHPALRNHGALGKQPPRPVRRRPSPNNDTQRGEPVAIALRMGHETPNGRSQTGPETVFYIAARCAET